MMRRFVWIRLLRLLCAGACVLPLAMARSGRSQDAGGNQPSHKNASAATVYHQQPAPAAQKATPVAQKAAPAASAPKAAQTTVQKQPAATAQPQPSASTSSSSPGYTYAHPGAGGQTKGSGTSAPAQSAPASAQSPGKYTYKPSQSVEPKAGGTQPSTPAQTPAGSYVTPGIAKKPPSSGETFDGPPASGSKSAPAQTPVTGVYVQPGMTKKPPASGGTSDGPSNGAYGGTSDGPAAGGAKSPGQTTPSSESTYKPPPPRQQPKPPRSAAPSWGLTLETSSGGTVPPRGEPLPPPVGKPVAEPPQQPVASPPPSAPPESAPPDTPPQVQSPPQQQAPQLDVPAASKPEVVRPQTEGRPGRDSGVEGGAKVGVPVAVLPVAALTLTTKTARPVVGRDVVVVAALEPALAGASYRLNWGDGSAVETVSGSGMHQYAKAKLYKVSASTVVGGSEFNHEILLDVGPAGTGISRIPRIDWLLAALAGLAALFLQFPPVPKLTASCRWGEPGVEMKLLSREPYLSLSFEPGAGPAEEDITFSKKRRNSGLEQG